MAITDANGTAVSSGNATSAGTGTGEYTYVLPGQATLKLLTVVWSATIAGTALTETTYVDVSGGLFFSLAAGRASDQSLSDTNRYPTADLEAARLEVETECETICDRTFVPRYERIVLDGTGTSELLLRHNDPTRSVAHVRSIRSVSMAPAVDETFVAFTAAELAALAVSADGTLRRTDGAAFTEERRNILVEFEYGLDRPPADLIKACLTRFRSRLNLNKSGIPDRASSFTVAEGGIFRLDMPGAFKTGLPEVDAVYGRYSRRSGAGTGSTGRGVPASRTLDYNPQTGSLFHGGVR
ncbi:MAG TPA: hypothetical protein VGD39_19015 [Nocardioides sp.]